MFDNLAFVIAFAGLGALFVIGNVAFLSRILRPRVKNATKETIYECGEPTIGSSWVRFDYRFYTVAIVFLIFEVEVAFLFPWAVIFKDLKAAGPFGPLRMPFVLIEAGVFLIILAVGVVYVWAKGDLDWVKATISNAKPAHTPAAATAPPAADRVGAEGGVSTEAS